MSQYELGNIFRSQPHKPMFQGMSFAASTPKVVVPAGQRLNMVLTNPITSTRPMMLNLNMFSVLPGGDFTQGAAQPDRAVAWLHGIFNPTLAGMTVVTPTALYSKSPPFTTVMEARYSVGASVGTDAFSVLLDDSLVMATPVLGLDPGQSLGFSIESHENGTEMAIRTFFQDTNITPAPSDRRVETVELAAAAPGWFAKWTPVSGIGVDLAPIAIWVQYADGDIEGFIADENGHVRAAKTLTGFLGYLPPTGTTIT